MDNETKLLIGLLTLVVAFYAGLFAWAVQRDQRQAVRRVVPWRGRRGPGGHVAVHRTVRWTSADLVDRMLDAFITGAFILIILFTMLLFVLAVAAVVLP